MSIRKKLYLILALFLLQPVALITGAYFHGVSDQRLMQQIHLAHTELEVRYEILAGVSRQMNEATDILLTGDVEEVEEFRRYGQTVVKSFKKLERPEMADMDWRESVRPSLSETTELRSLYTELTREIESVLNLASAGRREEAIEWVEEIVEKRFDTEFLPMLDRQVKGWRAVVASTAEAAATETAAIGSFAVGLSSLLAMVFAAIAMLIAFPLIKGISSQLQAISLAAGSIGAGRLDTRIKMQGENELGHLAVTLNSMAEKLDRYVSELALAIVSRELV
ncbi:HAMP domain-containing protein [Leisingera sp.]|uniref:HAMP domain-containing protein n=1 Tax=Leisingera sp. TaxID=1879318 RepID=UPI003A94D5BB